MAQTAKLVTIKNKTAEKIEFKIINLPFAFFIKNPNITIAENDKYTATLKNENL